MALPYPGMDFVPFDILTAEEQDQLVANIESLAAGTGFDNNVIPSSALANGSITLDYKLATGNLGSLGTGDTLIPGLTSTVDFGASNTRLARVTVFMANVTIAVAGGAFLKIFNSATVTGTAVQTAQLYITTSSSANSIMAQYITPIALTGSQSFCASCAVSTAGAGTVTTNGTGQKTFLLIELI